MFFDPIFLNLMAVTVWRGNAAGEALASRHADALLDEFPSRGLGTSANLLVICRGTREYFRWRS